LSTSSVSASNSGIPYPTRSTSSVTETSAASAAPVDTTKRITPHNFSSFEKREKALPPDACVEKAPRTKLWQFPGRVIFFCSKCRKDGISAESLAYDPSHQLMICVKCFERIIRPKKFRPSRVVPFPSLLSWLNYKPATVMTEVSSDVSARPAEAAAPSGNRVATDTLGGGGAADLKALPASASMLTRVAASSTVSKQTTTQGQGSSQYSSTDSALHPCLRVWGSCAHGPLCEFREAPRNLCIAHLMGLCAKKSSVTEGATEGDANSCPLIHQFVFDLPRASTVALPTSRIAGEERSPVSELFHWIDARKKSKNRAEWQLFNNGPLEVLLNEFVPCMELPSVPDALSELPNTDEVDALPLNVADITSALEFLN